ncbi:MAG: histidine phosphatase family protein [Chloroflexi bacterium]|nr:histidine phosphatase family protein [Chloroflexota bacterium]
MKEIILVRHGQTEWNRVERFRGRRDIDLNDRGRGQARLVARRLSEQYKVSVVYASPLKRTFETAGQIARMTGAELTVENDLIDLNFGEVEGLAPAEVEEKYPGVYHSWLERPQEVAFPGGESLADVRQRVTRVLRAVAELEREGAAVLVSHRVPCKLAVCIAIGIDNSHFWQIEQENGGISLLAPWDDRFTVRFVNDTCHLW